MYDATTFCPVCGSGDLVFGFKYTNEYWPHLEYLNQLHINACSSCGFGYSWPEIPDQVVNEFYRLEYRKFGSPFYIDYDSLLAKPLQLDKRALAQILLAKQYVDFKDGDLFLEIGPGGGGAFNVAEEVLPSPKMIGIELNEGASAAFKRIYGIEIIPSASDFISMGLSAKICLFSHSLEHFKLSWLESALEEYKKLISADGVVVIEVPLVDMRKHQNCRYEDSPHFLFFSLESIQLLFEQNNWQVLYLNSSGLAYSDWMSRKKNDPGTNSSYRSRIISNLRYAAKRLHIMLPKFMRQIIRWFFGNREFDFTDAEFSYGGDRTCLRIIARPGQRVQL